MREKGFTLVEVLVAVVIVGLLLTAVYGVFTSVAGAKQRLEAEGEGYHQARVLFDRLGRELRGAYKGKVPFTGGFTDEKLPTFELTTTAGTPYGGGQGGISVVRYELTPDPEAPVGENTRVLMRNEYSTFDPDGANREGYRLIKGIGEMEVRYYKNDRWYEEWPPQGSGGGGGFPELVEVTVSLPVEARQVPFRSTFEIPIAARQIAIRQPGMTPTTPSPTSPTPTAPSAPAAPPAEEEE